MSDAIFVLNAGSSSLKFSVYGLADQDLSVVAHGEIEGLGASAHFKAKDERGRTLADVSLGDSTRSFGHAEAFAHLRIGLTSISPMNLCHSPWVTAWFTGG